MSNFTIRPIRPGDEETVVALLRALADYEKLLERFHITPEVVRRDYLCDRPLLFCDLLFEGEEPAGVATWYWTYGSFAAARKAYLADLFVKPEFRGRRYGQALIGNLARRVLAHGGIGIDWEVLDWNKPSIDFYDSLGATSIKNWFAYNLSGEALAKAAKA
ncbi:MAG TPA: GNAT family N-acetyltransferase [Rhizomicrobium sp.]|nr:GNAT family N-acetyltransferase [Rhizomicrobium sp.]